jgi:hypothetical protein
MTKLKYNTQKYSHYKFVERKIAWFYKQNLQYHFGIKCYSNTLITKPDFSFGSNQVDFGGMIFPESAIAIN